MTVTAIAISWQGVIDAVVSSTPHTSGALMEHDSFIGHARVMAIFTHKRSPVGLVLAYTEGNGEVLAMACHIAHGRCGKYLGESAIFSARSLGELASFGGVEEVLKVCTFWQRAREEHGPLVEVLEYAAPAGLHRETFTTCVGPHDVVVTLTGHEESVYVMRAMIQHIAEFGDKCVIAQQETSE
jgi:hypothetical protein